MKLSVEVRDQMWPIDILEKQNPASGVLLRPKLLVLRLHVEGIVALGLSGPCRFP